MQHSRQTKYSVRLTIEQCTLTETPTFQITLVVITLEEYNNNYKFLFLYIVSKMLKDYSFSEFLLHRCSHLFTDVIVLIEPENEVKWQQCCGQP